jgi:hypothetical protein
MIVQISAFIKEGGYTSFLDDNAIRLSYTWRAIRRYI